MATTDISQPLLTRQAAGDMNNAPLDHSTNAPRILAIVGTLTGIAGLLVILRCYVRLFVLRRFYVEDGIMVVAMLLSGAVLACFVGETHHGLGQYMATVFAENNFVPIARWFWAHAIIIVLGISLVKVSIGFFLLRFTNQKKFLRPFILGSLIFLALFTLASILTLILQCIPIKAAWDFTLRSDPGTKCYSNNTYLAIARFNSSINIITDFIYALLPVYMFYDIQVNRRTKASLMGILGLGFFACAAAIVKAVYQASVFEEPEMYRDADYHIWNSVEFNVGIIAACFPTIKPLVKSIIGSTRSLAGYASRTRKRTNGEYYGGNSHYGANSHALASMHRSRVDNEEDKYRVQIHANHPSLSGSDAGSEEDLAANSRKQGHMNMNTRIVQTTEVTVHSEDSADLGAGGMGIGPRRTVEDRI
ncbi:hypothetical protein BJY04DRAFT_224512 [Aspergillus karnatakaensis]|uniref:uncharacterized protein n=1 Tax=Aspergillus karnatakaensis TaxID=1810916 RepID=UPI003CCCB010